MSVFRRGVKLQKGALPDELGSSSSEEDDDDDVLSEEEGSEQESGDEEEEEAVEEEEDDEDNVDLGWRFEPKEPAEPGKKKKRGGGGDEDSGSEGDEEEAEDDGTVTYPVTCQICEKVMFDQASAERHLQSKKHLQAEKRFEQQEKSSKMTPEQIEKRKARNRAKKERKMQRKSAESKHVWGEHKLPPKKPSGKKAQGGGEQVPARKRKADADAEEVGLEAASIPKKEVKKALSGGGGDRAAGKKGLPPGGRGKGKAPPPQPVRDKADGGSAAGKRKKMAKAQ